VVPPARRQIAKSNDLFSTVIEPMAGNNSFGPHQRLISGGQFDRVFKKNIRSADQYFLVLARTNHLTYARLGMAISRKAAGDAVPRNLLKRLVRESFRCTEITNLAVDLIVMARPAAAKTDNNTLLKSLDQHWSRVEKRCAPFLKS
jgi:ribonuclease P protein component